MQVLKDFDQLSALSD